MKPSVAPGFYSKPHVVTIDSAVREFAEDRSSFGLRDLATADGLLSADA